MADATDHVEKLQRAVKDLKGAEEKVRQAAEMAAGLLRGMGLSGVAEKVENVSQRVDRSCRQACDATDEVCAKLMDQICVLDLVVTLKDKFAQPLAAVDALLAELKGRNALDWQGIGADAYKEHTDVQRDAAGELSESANMAADVILSDIKSAQELANAIAIAIVTAVAGFVVGCISLPPPVTSVGLAAIALAVVAFLTALVNCKAAYDKRQADVREGLAKLKAPAAGGKSKFGKGHWPQRKLYS